MDGLGHILVHVIVSRNKLIFSRKRWYIVYTSKH